MIKVEAKWFINVVLFFVTILLITTNSYAKSDPLASCPSIKQLHHEIENTKIRFYGVNTAGEIFKAADSHTLHAYYFFYYYIPKSFNPSLSRYDETTDKLFCAYDIDRYDAADGEYMDTLQDYMTKIA